MEHSDDVSDVDSKTLILNHKMCFLGLLIFDGYEFRYLFWVLFVQTCTKCFICNALSKDLEVLPANYEIRISFKWELYNIAG